MFAKHSRRFFICVAAVLAGLAITQCSDDPAAPTPPGSIVIDSGNNQYYRRGMMLPEALSVVVKNDDGSAAVGATVLFTVLEGGGVPSSSSTVVGSSGKTGVFYTLGAGVGLNRIRASLKDEPSKSVVFQATSSNFFCPEAEDSLSVSYGTPRTLFIATQNSGLYPMGSAGIVSAFAFNPTSIFGFRELPPENFILTVVRDLAFSQRGDLYLSRFLFGHHIVKIGTGGAMSFFASLDDESEITTNPSGLVVGCDKDGPFVVACSDSIVRYSELAGFAGNVSNDAVAVDPRRQADDVLGEDIYFIHLADSTLMRLPMDSLSADGAATFVTQLTSDEAMGTNGMVCDADGVVWMLVDTDNTKKLIKVDMGVKTTHLDFFVERGPGDAAGIQRDLAIYDQPQSETLLYTLDTLNGQVLVCKPETNQFFAIFADSLDQDKLSQAASSGERVGLDILR